MAKRYTLSDIKALATGNFFDRKTMKFFKGDTYGTRYYDGKNYLYSLREGSKTKGIAWWHFDPATGKLHPLGGHKPEGVRDV
jgi:hypothetical protein